jgi:YesN/AraC family two-component response regulator
MNNQLQGNITGTLKVFEYLNSFKNLNPMAYSVAVYYSRSKLLISTDYIRYANENNVSDNKILLYNNLVSTLMDRNGSRYGFIACPGADMFSDSATARPFPANVINIIRILPDSQNNYVAVFITVDSDILHKMIQKYTPDSLESIMVVDENGIVVSHTDIREVGSEASKYSFLNNFFKQGEKSGNITRIVNRVMTVISYQTSEVSDWKYIALTPTLNINAVTRYILKTIIYIALFTVLLCILIALFTAKYLERPIKNIAAKCRQISDFIGTRGRNEYSIINNTLDGLAEIMLQKELEMKEITPVLTANFINWLLSDKVSDSEEIYKKMKVLRIEFTYKKFFIMALKIKSMMKEYSPEDNEHYSYAYEKARMSVILEKSLNTGLSRCIANNREDILLFFINHDTTQDILSEMCREAIEQDANGYIHYAAFGQDTEDITQIPGSFREAIDSLGYSFLYPEKRIFTFNEVSKYQSSYMSNKLLHNNLLISLKSENFDKVISDFDSVINALRVENCSLKQVNFVLTSVASTINDFLNSKDDRNSRLMDPVGSFSDIADFTVTVKEMLSERFKLRSRTESDNTSQIISGAKEYIEKNLLNSQLSLEAVAKHLGISSNYLSRVFRNECDITFIEYVTSLKMQLGRKLLIESEMKIDEIANLLGYSTPQYFISRFKSSFSCTPNVYRNQYKTAKTETGLDNKKLL